MRKIPPIAPIYATGRLGVVQLPRLWSKLLLDAKGLLPEGYFPCGEGFDRLVLEGLGLPRAEVVHFVQTNLPTYPEFEDWILSKVGPIPPEKVEALNRQILEWRMRPERRQEILTRCGLPDEGTPVTSAALAAYDDWDEFHRYLVREA